MTMTAEKTQLLERVRRDVARVRRAAKALPKSEQEHAAKLVREAIDGPQAVAGDWLADPWTAAKEDLASAADWADEKVLHTANALDKVVVAVEERAEVVKRAVDAQVSKSLWSVAAPVALVLGLYWLAKRRAR